MQEALVFLLVLADSLSLPHCVPDLNLFSDHW